MTGNNGNSPPTRAEDLGEPVARIPEYTEWLTSSLSRYEQLAKSLIEHRAEKGRIVESVVKSALRSMLPGRFSIGTGFAITASGTSSSQLDLIIYDGLDNSPITLEGGTGLFPIECIYGFVEVKSVLDTNAIASFTKAIGTIRTMSKEKIYIKYGPHLDASGNTIVGEYECQNNLSPRCFLFAINSHYVDISGATGALKTFTHENHAHVHGLAVMEKDWFITQKAYTTPYDFVCEDDRSLARFCATVLYCIQSFPMGAASMTRYLGLRK